MAPINNDPDDRDELSQAVHPFFQRPKKKPKSDSNSLQSQIDSSNALNRAIQAEKKSTVTTGAAVGSFFTKKERPAPNNSDQPERTVHLKSIKNSPPPWPTASQLIFFNVPPAPPVIFPTFKKMSSTIKLTSKPSSRLSLPYSVVTKTSTSKQYFDPTSLIQKITLDLTHHNQPGLCLLVHGPIGSGKSHFACQTLPPRLSRKLILLDGSLPRTPKSLETLQTTLLHTPPSSLVIVIDSLEACFAEERGFYGALSAFLGSGLPSGLLVIITSTMPPELINTHLMRLPSDTVRCLSWPFKEQEVTDRTTLQADPETLSFTDAYASYCVIERVFEAGEMAWSHQIVELERIEELQYGMKDVIEEVSINKSLPKKLLKRFSDYTRSLNRFSLWQTELTWHVQSVEQAAKEFIKRRRPRPHYLYLDEPLYRDLFP